MSHKKRLYGPLITLNTKLNRPNLAGTLEKPRERIGKQKNDTILRWCRDAEKSPKSKESLKKASHGNLAKASATLTFFWAKPQRFLLLDGDVPP